MTTGVFFSFSFSFSLLLCFFASLLHTEVHFIVSLLCFPFVFVYFSLLFLFRDLVLSSFALISLLELHMSAMTVTAIR